MWMGLSRFFSAPDDATAPPVATAPSSSKPAVTKIEPPVTNGVNGVNGVKAGSVSSISERTAAREVQDTPATADSASDTTTARALRIIASESGQELTDLTDDASFADLGVVVGGSLFLEYSTTGDLRSWLNEYYS
ncbi:hypothetical protein BDV06DRAFT_222500 [Aspergillus oleicola]